MTLSKIDTTPHMRYEDIRKLPGDFHPECRWALLDYDANKGSFVVLGGAQRKAELQEYACTIKIDPRFKIVKVV